MIVKRRLSDVDPLGPVAASLGIATLLVTPLFAIAGLLDSVPSADTFASIAVLGLLCSALAFLLFFRLIAEITDPAGPRSSPTSTPLSRSLGGGPRRERHDRGGRGPPDPGRLVAVHRRAPAARAGEPGRARADAPLHEVPRLPARPTAAVLRSGDDAAGELGI